MGHKKGVDHKKFYHNTYNNHSNTDQYSSSSEAKCPWTHYYHAQAELWELVIIPMYNSTLLWNLLQLYNCMHNYRLHYIGNVVVGP